MEERQRIIRCKIGVERDLLSRPGSALCVGLLAPNFCPLSDCSLLLGGRTSLWALRESLPLDATTFGIGNVGSGAAAVDGRSPRIGGIFLVPVSGARLWLHATQARSPGSAAKPCSPRESAIRFSRPLANHAHPAAVEAHPGARRGLGARNREAEFPILHPSNHRHRQKRGRKQQRWLGLAGPSFSNTCQTVYRWSTSDHRSGCHVLKMNQSQNRWNFMQWRTSTWLPGQAAASGSLGAWVGGGVDWGVARGWWIGSSGQRAWGFRPSPGVPCVPEPPGLVLLQG